MPSGLSNGNMPVSAMTYLTFSPGDGDGVGHARTGAKCGGVGDISEDIRFLGGRRVGFRRAERQRGGEQGKGEKRFHDGAI